MIDDGWCDNRLINAPNYETFWWAGLWQGNNLTAWTPNILEDGMIARLLEVFPQVTTLERRYKKQKWFIEAQVHMQLL